MHKTIVKQLLTKQREAESASQTPNDLILYVFVHLVSIYLNLYEDNTSTAGTSWNVNKWQY